MKELPNFLIIGAQKAGTTTLHNALSQHPEVYMPKIKELNFYINEQLFNKGIGSYKAMFNPTNEIAIGEASPGYMCHPLVPKRIFETNNPWIADISKIKKIGFKPKYGIEKIILDL